MTRRRGKPGPDPFPPEALRRRRVSVYLTEGEYQELLRRAGMPRLISTYLRNAALGRDLPRQPIPEVNRELWADLARLAGNLNQLQKAINQGRMVQVSDLEKMVQALRDEVAWLRFLLIGGESS